nr:MAG TPA: adenine-specific methyltransferase [Caudoviricetes sp.]
MSQSKMSFADYDEFVEKFKPKKTTDDCYTPPEIYAVVLDYVRERWGVGEADVVRPFWPGGDFESFEYPDGCVVVDNPPFSILARIQAFYRERGIRFFLFAPSLTCLSGKRCMEVDHIVCDCSITYENGAVVRTGFITNLDEEHVLEADPELGRRLNEANDARLKATKKTVPKYEYPDEVITAARAQWLAAHNTPFRVRRSDACRISALDEQRSQGKSIFGGGLLLSKRAAAERAAAERWHLSERERAMQAMLGKG